MLTALGGLLAGAVHTLGGPDHLAAVAPLAVDRREPGAGWAVGGLWGVGHGLGVVLVAVGVQAMAWGGGLDGSALVQGTGWAAELLVGLLLVGLGLRTLVRVGAPARQGHHPHPISLGFGLLHGMAGASHLAVVLPSLAMEHQEALVYLGGYLAAAVVTMALVGAALARLGRSAGAGRLLALSRGAGGVSFLVGLVWIVRAVGG